MKNGTFYVEKASIVHNVDPLSKLLFVFVSVAITYMLSNQPVVSGVLAFTLLLLLLGKVLHNVLPIIGLSLVLIFSIIVVQGFFHPDRSTVWFTIGSVPIYKEGFSYALLLTLRVLNMVCAFGVLILTTKPDDLVQSLIRKGMSPKIGYVLLSVLQILPQMIAATGKITDAQRARGMETEGGLSTRVKSFIPLLTPVVLNSINDTRDRSIALEIRGFNSTSERTFLHETNHFKYGFVIKILLAASLAAVIAWRIFI
ncbi:energy-coupling factor transporter transmembrane protein EcfT [Sporosarcina sp. BI001-red]|uniref:energy-coupling factor transporter transmembrane component T family protein n=1 Tax=Sporosarcina sp. BI001-red TaxID=2282866 RepID=UPI000E280FB9|nr:energy-coupling factor transporter transmembrane component T [Sporosarcina sp. BI001-red]REB11607.1 energy-coupling factor transporter transmembrane protein EcfT [Sporosarcina sp. BI001-red]